ncbi:hypothetical protein P170DRAFT_458845 [Aspergillus steynii IBT 23096]|uniref:Zn(2)-C6 fungal-type domain-containing protein n=1 Tax=Aspergillus steynii IBT 23096 TaxID=1392250 RepID=A0A2I2FU66_9EURO|nr:uncharacterized protein P170DRAFT_458845 [Aspergillus steynii IBT 23096]PLB44151.1 hypothetical protein P170DRAFT_458845 [Aspergillus steynii IBT 23096]
MEEYNDQDSSGLPDNADHPSRAPEVGHACNACRKRKLRCSRELPTCQHCRKSAYECLYEAKRAKPGMKAGALDNLHRRLDGLECSIERHQAKLESLEAEEPHHETDPNVHAILSSLATNLQNLSRRPAHRRPANRGDTGDSAKRRRTNDVGLHPSFTSSNMPPLPDDTLLISALETYFCHVHPWMPIIHEARFRRRLEDDAERDKLHLVIHSIVLVASRHERHDGAASREDVRDWIVSQAMKQSSAEALQALVIIAYNDIGNGFSSHAWSLIGCLSRMVEYLQLTVEHDEAIQSSFTQPYNLLQRPKNWTEAEERRRLFWSIFALDRFCSEDPVVTPYFGIWDKSAGRIGNPIAFLPSHPVPARVAAETEGEASSEAAASPGATAAADMTTVGAYAYCIEATESLSRVTSYFLQQKVNMHDQRAFGAWLTRFKELDLRLVHWKMLLPQKWAINVTQQTSSKMDPNLTLAHVTHNASMILLHQPIAFPLPSWPFKNRLPSLCSVDTCQTAAIEVASITNQYLKNSSPESPLSSQFAFCVFIAARALLLSWQHSSAGTSVASDFWTLINALDVMSARWKGVHDSSEPHHPSLAAKYSATLSQLHRRCSQDDLFYINPSGYTTEIMHSTAETQSSSNTPLGAGSYERTSVHHFSDTSTITQPAEGQASSHLVQTNGGEGNVPTQISPMQNQSLASLGPNPFTLHMASAIEQGDGDDPMAISQMLLGQQFTDLDRVISFNDGIFGSEFEARRW